MFVGAIRYASSALTAAATLCLVAPAMAAGRDEATECQYPEPVWAGEDPRVMDGNGAGLRPVIGGRGALGDVGRSVPATTTSRVPAAPPLAASTYLTEVDIDETGRRLAWVAVDMGAVPPSSTIYLDRGDGGVPQEVGTGRAVRFRPGSEGLAWLAAGGDGLEIRIADGAGAELDTVRASGGVREFAWSPDGSRLVFAAPGLIDGATPGDLQLFVYEPGSGEARRVTGFPGTVHTDPFGAGGSFSWAPDGRRVAFAVQSASTVEGAYGADLHVIDVDDGRVRPLVERPGLDTRPVWSPDGSRIAFATSFGVVDRFAAHGVAIVDVRSGRVDDVGRALDGTFLEAPSGHGWTADGESILVVKGSGAFTDLVRLDGSTGELSPLTDEGGTVALPRFDRAVRTAVYLRSDPGTPWEIRRLDLRARAEEPAGPRGEGPRRDWAVRRWTTPSGDRLEGLLLSPSGGTRAGGSPLLVWLHGGPDGRSAAAWVPAVPFPTPPFDPLPLDELLAEGYAVFLPNDRPSAGYPASLRTSVAGRSAQALESDILSGVDELIRDGTADPDRLFLGGWASGGLRADQLLTRTTRFRAAVSGAANTALEAAYGDGDFTVQWHSVMGGSPWERPEAWDAASPLRNAASITTPLLLLHGGADPLVPVDHSRYLFTYLDRLGRTVRLDILEGAGHGIVMPEQRSDAAARIIEWFRSHDPGAVGSS